MPFCHEWRTPRSCLAIDRPTYYRRMLITLPLLRPTLRSPALSSRTVSSPILIGWRRDSPGGQKLVGTGSGFATRPNRLLELISSLANLTTVVTDEDPRYCPKLKCGPSLSL